MLNIKTREQEDVACTVRSLAMTELSRSAAEILEEFSKLTDDSRSDSGFLYTIGVLSELMSDFITDFKHTCKMFSCDMGLLLNPHKVYIWSENESPAEVVDFATYKNVAQALLGSKKKSLIRPVDIKFIKTSVALLNADIKKLLKMYKENQFDLDDLGIDDFRETATRVYRNMSTLCSSYTYVSNYGVDGILVTFGDNFDVNVDIGITY